MANVNAPNGFRPLRHLKGGTIRANEYPLLSGTASNIFAGDAVKLLNTGVIDVAAATDTNLIGVVQGFQWTDTDGTPRFEKRFPTGQATLGAADVKALVFDDPDIVFEAQASTYSQTHNGNNADITATAGSSVTGISKHSIDMGSPGAGTAQIRILGLAEGSEAGAYARVECLIWEHLLRGNVAGI
jgi:hypothetical protein